MLSRQVITDMSGGSVIRKMFEEGTRLKAIYGADKVYDFSLGNPDMSPPAEFTESLRAAIDYPDVHKYMSNAGYPEVRRAIAQQESAKSGLSLTEQQVVMTVGAAGAINVAFKSILNPGDEVIVLAPYFVEYLYYIKNFGAKAVIVNVDPETFQPDARKIGQAVSPNTKAIILNTPNNPTGAIYSAQTLSEIAAVLEEKEKEYHTSIYVISDEPYSALCYEGEVPSLLKHFRNGIVGNSYSKSLCLPGERIGYLAVNPNADDAEQLCSALVFSLRTLGFVNAPSLMQRALLGSLNAKVDVEVYRERRDLLYSILQEAGLPCFLPRGAFYLFPQAPNGDADAFCAAAAEERILAVPGAGFGWPTNFRLAFCVDKGVIERSRESWMKLGERFNLK